MFFQDTWIADSRKASEISNFSQFSQFSFQNFCILDKNFDHYLIFNPIRSDSPLKIHSDSESSIFSADQSTDKTTNGTTAENKLATSNHFWRTEPESEPI